MFAISGSSLLLLAPLRAELDRVLMATNDGPNHAALDPEGFGDVHVVHAIEMGLNQPAFICFKDS